MKVTYVVDLEHRDVMIAIYALHYLGFLDYLVCDPRPLTPEAISRYKEIKSMGIKVSRRLKSKSNKVVIVNAPLSAVSRYLRKKNHYIEILVVAGGFIGKYIEGSNETREFSMVSNFNEDFNATLCVLHESYTKIGDVWLVSKNVYSSPLNYEKGIWGSPEFWSLFQTIDPNYRSIPQYALLTVMEGLHIAMGSPTRCEYMHLYPTLGSFEGRKSLWGSGVYSTGMRDVHIAVRIRDDCYR